MTEYKLGGDVDSWCTRCKMILAHTIEALVGSEIKRVVCNTCKGKHMYRPNAPGTKKAASKTAGATRTVAASKASYAALLAKNANKEPVFYSTDIRFSPGAVLEHPSFGIGFVTADKDGCKIDVAFPDGNKVLMHAR